MARIAQQKNVFPRMIACGTWDEDRQQRTRNRKETSPETSPTEKRSECKNRKQEAEKGSPLVMWYWHERGPRAFMHRFTSIRVRFVRRHTATPGFSLYSASNFERNTTLCSTNRCAQSTWTRKKSNRILSQKNGIKKKLFVTLKT
jgi:hypothetical protein